MEFVEISTHNLKIRRLELPERALIVVTGVSGSGKSSLVFDTVALEGKRRYLELLSLVEPVRLPARPPVRDSRGVPPSVGFSQRVPPPSPHHTLSTAAGLWDVLKVLFLELGELPCPFCFAPLGYSSPLRLQETFEQLEEGTLVVVTSPLPEPSPKAISYLKEEGFWRFFVDDLLYDLSEEDPPSELKRVEVVVDRIVKREGSRSRFFEAIRLAVSLSGGPVILRLKDGTKLTFTLGKRCPHCLREVWEVSEELLSYAGLKGRCPACSGTGKVKEDACSLCSGLRLRPEVLEMRVLGTSLKEILKSPLKDLKDFVTSKEFKEAVPHRLKTVRERLERLLEVLCRWGLGKLALFSPYENLSTGERKRLEVAAVFASSISGCLIALDEPSLGLSLKEKKILLEFLKDLVENGNTVIVVEHDPLFVLEADLVVELGPGPAEEGGEVIFLGPPEELKKNESVPTGGFLSGKKRLKRSRRLPERRIPVEGTPGLPLGILLCVTGASGSGKTLLLKKMFRELRERGIEVVEVRGELRERAKGMVASYSGIFDAIRRLFASTKKAKAKGLSPAHFSPYTKEGRCEECKGEGVRVSKVPGVFEVEAVCSECGGCGLKPEVLEVTYKGYSLKEVLLMSVREAEEVFGAVPEVQKRLRMLSEAGLGYLRLGQKLSEVSGGERLRLSLTKGLFKERAEVLLLDLPFMGLHYADSQRLLNLFDRLLTRGKTLVIAETQPPVVLLSDEVWVVDEGEVVFWGAVEEGLKVSEFLRDLKDYEGFVERR